MYSILFNTKLNFFLTILLFSFQLQAQDFVEDSITDYYTTNLVVSDLNGDSYDDIWGYNSNLGIASIMMNNGTDPVSFTAQLYPDQTNPIGKPAFNDFDGDGDVDFFIAEDNGTFEPEFYLYTNDGVGNFEKTNISQINNGMAGHFFIALEDFDGDGDLDILGADGYEFMTVVLYENLGGLQFETHTIHDANWTSDKQNILNSYGDLDNDGDIDIVIVTTDSNSGQNELLVYLNDGDNGYQEEISITEFSSASDLKVLDFDGDDQLDIITLTTGECNVWLNQGNNNFNSNNLSLNGISGFQKMIIEDYDNNGKKDIAIITSLGYIRWFRNISMNSDFIFEESAFVGDLHPFSPDPDVDWYSSRLQFAGGDFNNDEKPDLVAAGSLINPNDFSFFDNLRWYTNKTENTTSSTLNFEKNQLDIYPNPSQDFIQIKNFSLSKYQMDIHTISGQIINSRIVDSELIDLSNLSNGIYILTLTDLNSQESKSTKLVKQK